MSRHLLAGRLRDEEQKSRMEADRFFGKDALNQTKDPREKKTEAAMSSSS